MAFESDLIRRYRGAFSKDECKEIIDYINFFEDNQILEYDKSALELEDHKIVNVTYDYDPVSYTHLTLPTNREV